MTSTLLVLLLLSQAQRPDDPPAGAVEPPLSASSAGGWHSLARLEASALALVPRAGVGAEVALDVEHLLFGRPKERGRYTLGTGGTLLFVDGGGTPRPGAFASVGLGVDHAR